MLRISSAEQAIDGDVEIIFVDLAGVVVLAALSKNVRRDDVGASGVMRRQGSEEC